MPNVLIVGGGMEYGAMFRRWGWDMVDNLAEAELLQFTGGEDVTPDLYGHFKHKNTWNNVSRDRREQLVFQLALKRGLPMTGICRGGQFLNVMCGGKMWQDIDGHAVNSGHYATDTRTGETFLVTSTHHQMMIPAKENVEVILSARVSTWGEKCVIPGQILHIHTDKMQDIEALYYPTYKVFCFQPHPEYVGRDTLQRHYFEYLEEFFDLKSGISPLLPGILPGKPISRVVPGL